MGQICSFCGSKEEQKKSSALTDTSSTSDIPDTQLSSQQQSNTSAPLGRSLDGSSSNLDPNHPPVSSSTHDHDHTFPPGIDPSLANLDQVSEKERQRRLEQYRVEQAELARREAIVSAASQSMVPVGGSNQSPGGGGGGGFGVNLHNSHRGGGGIYTYYDPAYAAAAAQDILNSAARSGGLMFADDTATRAAWNVSVMGVMPLPTASSNGMMTSKDVMDTLGRGRWDGIRLGSRGSGVAGCGGEEPEYYLDDLAEAFMESMVPTKTALFGGCPSIVENLP